MTEAEANPYMATTNRVDLEIDPPTGLPKLSIELLPEAEPYELVKDKDSGRQSHQAFLEPHSRRHYVYPGEMSASASKLPNNTAMSVPRDCDSPPMGADLRHSASSPECRQRSYSGTGPGSGFNRPAKQRSSLFIKLHRTSTSPQRLSILTETMSGTSDTGIHTAPVVAFDPDSKFSFPESTAMGSGSSGVDGSSPCTSQSSTSTTVPDLLAGSFEDSTPLPPITSPSSSSIPKRLASTGRRNSFLYDVEEGAPVLQLSRTSSMSSHVEETYVTPFAQILATMHRVRQNFITVMGLPDEAHQSHSHFPLTPGPHPTKKPVPLTRKLSLDQSKQLAKSTLEQIDWCLHQLETVESAKTMGGAMAQDKFRRLLSRELSHMSEHSRSGNKLAEWMQDITGSTNERNLQVDRALSQDSAGIKRNDVRMDARLSGSMSHDVWRKNAIQRSNSGTIHHVRLQDYCERVPTFGVADSGMDVKQMRQFMMEEIDRWSPNVFHLDEVSAGNPLVCAAYQIVKQRALFSAFKVSPPLFINFMMAIQNQYRKDNPYHNRVHAADVLLTTNFLLKATPIENIFSELEVFAALVAAAVHDVDHPGKSNQFLIETSDDLALLYNDNSVLENHHLAVAFKTMTDANCNFLENMEKEQKKAFRGMVIDMVLATDMSVHFKHLAELKTLLETKKLTNDGILELDNYKERSELLQCLIHCADLSNPAKDEALAVDWSHRIMQESFKQGDEERQRGIPMNPLGDRNQVSVEKCQVTFIDLIVYPLFETWSDLVYPEAQQILDNLTSTRSYWESRVTQSPPPIFSTSSTSTAAPNYLDGIPGGSDEIFSNQMIVEECDVVMQKGEESTLTEQHSSTDRVPDLPPSQPKFHASSPAQDRRHSFTKSGKGEVLDEDR